MIDMTLAELKQTLHDAERTIDHHVAKVIRATAIEVAATQKAAVPVKTGKTRRSIKATGPDGGRFTATTLEAEVGPTWWVGRMIEHGTVKIPPRVFVANSVEPHRVEFEKEMSSAMTDGALEALTT